MPLAAGANLGPYEILGPLGAGGMGEVYKARDSRLGRIVAVKILPHHLLSSAARERFEREGRVVASLNHPHICTLHDIGNQDGVDYLVMEYLEGETLDGRLKKGSLPLDQTLRYGIQIADALDRAHRQGVLHRDLKPANIMLAKDGVKVLDFGLAKIQRDSAHDVTHSLALTGEGVIMGTLPYMAPEQVEGKKTDARADIFSFGAVLFEMATGQRAFESQSQAGLISAILSADVPAISTLLPGTPSTFDHVVKRCMDKDVERRWQTARDVMLELQWIAEGGAHASVTAAVPKPRKSWTKLAWAFAVLLSVFGVWLVLARSGPIAKPTQLVRLPLLPPPDSSFLSPHFASSPDGARVAFVAVGHDGKSTLWVRALSASRATQLNGTAGASHPFWSPDSRRVGFFGAGKLKTVDVEGGAIDVLADAEPNTRGGRGGGNAGSWNTTGTILFATSADGPLYRMSSTGGAVTPVTRVASQSSGENHNFPFFLPDGKHFLFTVELSRPEGAHRDGLYVGSLDTSAPKLVIPGLVGNAIFASGHLLYIRARTLLAQPFDPGRVEITGPPVPVAQGMETEVFPWSGFSASQNGLLVVQAVDESASRLEWFDASGKELGQLPVAGYKYPCLSPDGRYLAASSDDAGDGKYYVRVYDLSRGISTRLTDTGGELCPVWSHDGREISYGSTYTGAIYKVLADGSGHPQMQFQRGSRIVPNGLSPDGNMVFMDFRKGLPELAIYSARDHSVTPFGTESEAQFSPDGKWIAWCGSRGHLSGDVFVQRFPVSGGHLQISDAGAGQPRWSRDGRQIFYVTPDKKLMAVTFDAQRMSASAPRVLFQTRIVAPSYDYFQYDVAADGRFLVNSLPASYAPHLTLVSGWTALLNAR